MIEGKIPELKNVPKRKFFFMGQILRTDSLSPYGMQCELQSTINEWLGQGRAIIEIKDEGLNTLKFIIYRSYAGDYNERRFLPDGSFRFSDGDKNIYEVDSKIIIGKDYRTPMEGICAYINARMFLEKEDVIQAYKKAARHHHASRIKNVTIEDFPNRLEVTVEVW